MEADLSEGFPVSSYRMDLRAVAVVVVKLQSSATMVLRC